MKTMIYSLTLAALMITSSAAVAMTMIRFLTQKDLDGTTTYLLRQMP